MHVNIWLKQETHIYIFFKLLFLFAIITKVSKAISCLFPTTAFLSGLLRIHLNAALAFCPIKHTSVLAHLCQILRVANCQQKENLGQGPPFTSNSFIHSSGKEKFKLQEPIEYLTISWTTALPEASTTHPKNQSIQPWVYTTVKHMSPFYLFKFLFLTRF